QGERPTNCSIPSNGLDSLLRSISDKQEEAEPFYILDLGDEIKSIPGLGVRADKIVYANPCKAESHIKYAASVGVRLTTFDSEEVNKIEKWHPKCWSTNIINVGGGFKANPLSDEIGATVNDAIQEFPLKRLQSPEGTSVKLHSL
ncbi:hypothetical protein D5086_033151, partial [Populus alba]